MSQTRTLSILGGLMGSALVTFLMLGGGGDDKPSLDAPAVSLREGPGADDALESASATLLNSDAAGERREVDLEAMTAEFGSMQHAPLAIAGRVTDPRGNPIAGATVQVEHRPSFFGRGGGRGGPGGAGDFEQVRQLFENAQGGTPTSRRDMFRAVAERMRPLPLARPIVTDGDGTFALSGDAYESASLTIAAEHAGFAPTVVRREWESAAGELRLADIVLDDGVVIRGAVKDDSGAPVIGAEITYAQSNDFGGRGGPGGRGGRGGPGGRGGFGGFGGFGGGDVLARLIGAAVTDGTGSFELGPVPVDAFTLRGTADAYLDGESRQIEPQPDRPIESVEILMPRAVGLTGVVRDQAGAPIAGVEVTGTVAREAMMAQFRAARDQADPAAADTGRRGGRGNRMGGMRAAMDATETATTDQQGEFRLTKLPRALVRLTAEHADYLTTTEEPIDAQQSPHVTLSMPKAPIARGTVVDAVTGAPVETYGIAVRQVRDGQGDGGPDPGQNGRGGRGRRGNQQADSGGEPTPEQVAAEQAQRAAELARRQIFGESGRAPGRTPAPTHHADGAFQVTRLQDGTHAFDIDAPGYVRTSSKTFAVQGADVEGLVIPVERGAIVRGVVVDHQRQPVARARVEVTVPQTAGADNGGRGGFGGFGGGRGGRGGPDRIANVRTADDGSFELPPMRTGVVSLRVSAEDMLDYTEPALQLPRAGETRDLKITLTAGGALHGVVRSIEAGVSTQVIATHTQTNARRMANVDPATGEYELTGLLAGGYFVALMQRGGGDDARRTMMAAALAQRDRDDPDVIVQPGSNIRYDLTAGQEALGSVVGTVLWNNAPAPGVQVQLRKIANEPSNDVGSPSPHGGAQGPDRIAGMAERLLSARTDARGAFSVTKVPPGDYTVEFARADPAGDQNAGGRRGRGGPGGGRDVLHKERITVVAYGQASVMAQVQTSQFELRATLPPDLQGARTRVTVVDAAAAGDAPPSEWRGVEGVRSFSLRDGTTGAQELPPGNYRYRVSGRGLLEATGEFSVGLGQPTIVPVLLQAAPVDPDAPAGANGGRRGGGNTPGGNAPGGTQRGGNPTRGDGRRGQGG